MADYTKATADAIASVDAAASVQDNFPVQGNGYAPGPWPFPTSHVPSEPLAVSRRINIASGEDAISSGEDALAACPDWLHEGELTC